MARKKGIDLTVAEIKNIVDENGIIKTNVTNWISKSTGYHLIWINNRDFQVHRLVYRAYISDDIEGLIIHHKNENKLDNDFNNLEAMTRSEHMKEHNSIKNLFTDEANKKRKETRLIKILERESTDEFKAKQKLKDEKKARNNKHTVEQVNDKIYRYLKDKLDLKDINLIINSNLNQDKTRLKFNISAATVKKIRNNQSLYLGIWEDKEKQ